MEEKLSLAQYLYLCIPAARDKPEVKSEAKENVEQTRAVPEKKEEKQPRKAKGSQEKAHEKKEPSKVQEEAPLVAAVAELKLEEQKKEQVKEPEAPSVVVAEDRKEVPLPAVVETPLSAESAASPERRSSVAEKHDLVFPKEDSLKKPKLEGESPSAPSSPAVAHTEDRQIPATLEEPKQDQEINVEPIISPAVEEEPPVSQPQPAEEPVVETPVAESPSAVDVPVVDDKAADVKFEAAPEIEERPAAVPKPHTPMKNKGKQKATGQLGFTEEEFPSLPQSSSTVPVWLEAWRARPVQAAPAAVELAAEVPEPVKEERRREPRKPREPRPPREQRQPRPRPEAPSQPTKQPSAPVAAPAPVQSVTELPGMTKAPAVQPGFTKHSLRQQTGPRPSRPEGKSETKPQRERPACAAKPVEPTTRAEEKTKVEPVVEAKVEPQPVVAAPVASAPADAFVEPKKKSRKPKQETQKQEPAPAPVPAAPVAPVVAEVKKEPVVVSQAAPETVPAPVAASPLVEDEWRNVNRKQKKDTVAAQIQEAMATSPTDSKPSPKKAAPKVHTGKKQTARFDVLEEVGTPSPSSIEEETKVIPPAPAAQPQTPKSQKKKAKVAAQVQTAPEQKQEQPKAAPVKKDVPVAKKTEATVTKQAEEPKKKSKEEPKPQAAPSVLESMLGWFGLGKK